jgi:uncharacterized NAD-dependent epimerase/dehydratase family protein
MRGLPHQKLPGLGQCLEANLQAARLTNPEVRAVGVAIDTHRLEPGRRGDVLARIEDELALPTVDPIATGVGRIVDALW